MTLCSNGNPDFKKGATQTTSVTKKGKSRASYLTLTVFPRRPPQKGLKILDIDSTQLWAAILLY